VTAKQGDRTWKAFVFNRPGRNFQTDKHLLLEFGKTIKIADRKTNAGPRNRGIVELKPA
jgi:hypothetical protein